MIEQKIIELSGSLGKLSSSDDSSSVCTSAQAKTKGATSRFNLAFIGEEEEVNNEGENATVSLLLFA